MINKSEFMKLKTKKFFFWGAGGALALLVLYFLILTLASSASHAIEQFQVLWYWMLSLIVGFGVQVGLYAYIRLEIKHRKIKNAAKQELAASAGVSSVSMAACCAHHLIDVLPILGLSAAFLFLAQYQVWFIILGILNNIIGIIYMLEIIKKHSLCQKTGLLSQITRLNLKTIKYWAMAVAGFILLISFFIIRDNARSNQSAGAPKPLPENVELSRSQSQSIIPLPAKIDDQAGLSIEITPFDFSFDKPARFKILLNTHQGDLDFDLTRQSILIDDQGREYKPIEWQGGTGGHHLSGTLIFPFVKKTSNFKLIISDVYDVPAREFLWDLEQPM
jgi:hypothetical protein